MLVKGGSKSADGSQVIRGEVVFELALDPAEKHTGAKAGKAGHGHATEEVA